VRIRTLHKSSININNCNCNTIKLCAKRRNCSLDLTDVIFDIFISTIRCAHSEKSIRSYGAKSDFITQFSEYIFEEIINKS
jgi:hypothetical protein